MHLTGLKLRKLANYIIKMNIILLMYESLSLFGDFFILPF